MTTEKAIVSIPTNPNDREYDSKAMNRLIGRKRAFVIAMLQEAVNPKAAPRAAAKCGYAASYGYELMRDPDVIAALREEATKRLAGAALMGITVMMDIAQDPMHKDQYRAAKDLAAINGFTAEQRIVVEHINEDSKAQLQQVRKMAAELGMDPRQLIEAAGIIEGEFEEVKAEIVAEIGEPMVDDSDW